MSEMEFRDPRPYMRIADRFRQQILDGALKPGDALPSIAQIRRDLGHSRLTIGKAMAVLASEGFIFRTPGHPYCVASKPPAAAHRNR